MRDVPGRRRAVRTRRSRRRIYVSQSTVKTHVARAMTKVGARDRAQLVVVADQACVVRPGWAKAE